MNDKNIDMMKKIIEAKKQKSSEQGNSKRASGVIGSTRTVPKKIKKGGLFDK